MKAVQSLIFPDSKPINCKSAVKTGVLKLPPKVLRHIFSFFNEEELRKHIIPVCQQWREIAEDPIFWKRIVMKGNNIPSSYICNKIWQFNLVNEIIIKYHTESRVILRQICRCSEHLTHLVLRHCSGISEESLRYLLTACKNLKSLDLKGSTFRCLILYEELALAKNLEEINFSENPYFTVKNIMTVVMNVSNITGFHLSNFKPCDKVFLNDIDCYFMLTQTVFGLKRLTLDCSVLSSYTFSSIMKCKNLEYICLNYAFNFEGRDFENIWRSFKKLKALKIRFAHNVKDSNLERLFVDGQESMKNIEVIDFTGCSQVGDKGLMFLVKCCKNLRHLVIRNCAKVKTVRALINNCKNLELLNVAFCKNLEFNDFAIPSKLKELFVCDNVSQSNFAEFVKKKKSNVIVRMCQNEFNKVATKI